MVAFPDSVTEPVIGNGIMPHDYRNSNGNATEDAKIKYEDQMIIVPRVTAMADGKDVYTLRIDINGMDEKKLDMPPNIINTETAGVKQVVAGLKPSKQKDKDKKDISNNNYGGNESLSSGVSIVTISTVSNLYPGPLPNGTKGQEGEANIGTERWYQTILQVSIPFLIAGIGTIGAGLVLNEVKNWDVFTTISQLLILVPALLGLKGNLDMCLASRLSTQANLGNMNSMREIMKMIIGNIALVQIQAIVAAICVSLFAMTVSVITSENNTFVWNHAVLLAASSVSTATSSCFILDLIMIAVIMMSHRLKMNPDNLATPLAASFGDVVSISVLSSIASAFFSKLDSEIWVLYVIIGFYFLLLPCWIVIVLKNKYTRKVLKTGWVPVLSSLFISGFGGLILDRVVDIYHGFAIFQPIINGIGGNLVSVQASRTSTLLHKSSIMGILPPHTSMWVTPWTALIRGSLTAKTARILIAMAIPGQLIFVFVADYLNQGNCVLNAYFVTSYVTVAVLQVMFLLYVSYIMIHTMWRYKIDPDNSAIPYLTALGDLSGSLFLASAFWFIYTINHKYCTV